MTLPDRMMDVYSVSRSLPGYAWVQLVVWMPFDYRSVLMSRWMFPN